MIRQCLETNVNELTAAEQECRTVMRGEERIFICFLVQFLDMPSGSPKSTHDITGLSILV